MILSTVHLHDPASGARATILPALGFNCVSFRVPLGGREIEALWTEPGFDKLDKRAAGSGIPILFPFPGRIPGTSLEYDGRMYPLLPGDGRGNAIHGFVLDRPWRVLEQSGQHVVGCFQASIDDPSLLARWPADFQLTVSYRLAGNRLEVTATAANPSDRELPCGLGFHPYFRVPLGGPSADDCRVRVSASEFWELAEMLATGRRLPVDERRNLVAGRRFADLELDDVLTGLVFSDGWCTAWIEDPGSGRALMLRFDESFRHCVVYNPPHREAICIEPYSCVPGPFQLEATGIDSGLWRLAPGETRRAELTIELK